MGKRRQGGKLGSAEEVENVFQGGHAAWEEKVREAKAAIGRSAYLTQEETARAAQGEGWKEGSRRLAMGEEAA